MRSLLENKRLVLVLAALALVALTVLALSLNQVPFRQAERFGSAEVEEVQIYAGEVARIWAAVPVWKQLVLWGLIALLIVLLTLLMSPEMRKRTLLMLVRTMFTFWAIYFLIRNYGDRLSIFQADPLAGEPASAGENLPIPTFVPPEVSPTLSYLISFGFALIWLAMLWVLYRSWKKYQARVNRGKPLEEIARIARSSLNDLSSGRDSSDVIINCYLRMSDVVSSKRQLHRALAMTPHEFALRLEQSGLPGEAVGRLTRLFEAVRYGDRKSAPKDVTEAVSCLKTILHYCGEPV